MERATEQLYWGLHKSNRAVQKMQQAEEEYYQTQVLKRISDDISIEQNWNNHQNPLAGWRLHEHPKIKEDFQHIQQSSKEG